MALKKLDEPRRKKKKTTQKPHKYPLRGVADYSFFRSRKYTLFSISSLTYTYLLSLVLKIYKALACQLWEFSDFPLNISYIIARAKQSKWW